ncbi:DNA primase [Elysia marginata]|uniref:DNA primase n=1 Tax=Elysia marginata TaxID=1093978 RepID=A0AAV4JUV9_9GAST|nr:DNA primase [Elysia marginata]
MQERISQLILEKTDGGRLIMQELFPQWQGSKRPFKFRDERTASASIKLINGVYIYTDFGDDGKGRNAIATMCKVQNIDIKEAIKNLCEKYQVHTNQNSNSNSKPKITVLENFEDWTIPNFYLKPKPKISESEIKYIGNFVSQELAEAYNLYALECYIVKNSVSGRITKIESTKDYPIYAYINENEDGEKWFKIYQPLAEDKSFKFFYKGQKPKGFVFGMDRVEAEYVEKSPENFHRKLNPSSKLPYIAITSGGRDMLNMASMGYPSVCLNSETAELSTEVISRLNEIAQKVVYVPDNDDTGQRLADEIYWKYPSIYQIKLPEKQKYGFEKIKDVTDFVKSYKSEAKTKMSYFFKGAVRSEFWDEKINISQYQVEYFLKKLGFFKIDEGDIVGDGYKYDSEKSAYSFVKIENEIIKSTNPSKIRQEAIEKLKEMEVPPPILDIIKSKHCLKEARIKDIELYKYKKTIQTKDNQTFRFKNCKVDISKNNAHSSKPDMAEFSEKVIAHDFKLENSPIFSLSKDFKTFKKNKENVFLNFLINTSRMHHKQEKNKKSGVIDSPDLTPEQQREQHQNLISKLYAIGYLLSEYKDPMKRLAVLIQGEEEANDDNKIGGAGGSGKSLILEALSKMGGSENVDGKDKNFLENSHIWGNVTPNTRYITIDDTNKFFNFERFYSLITMGVPVNPKNKPNYFLEYKKAPKFLISSNYAISDPSPSSSRRSLYMYMSDYYNANKNSSSHSPYDDFGHRFFDDWNENQWDDFYNLMICCVKLYMSVPESEILRPPMEEIEKRQIRTQISETFIAWADEFFADGDKFNEKLASRDLRDDYFLATGDKMKSTAVFKRRLKNYVEYRRLGKFNPEELKGRNGRIQTRGSNGKTQDAYYIMTDKEKPPLEGEDKGFQSSVPF